MDCKLIKGNEMFDTEVFKKHKYLRKEYKESLDMMIIQCKLWAG